MTTILLDLDDYDAEKFVKFLRERAECIADQIEAQTKPSRIPEPGLWGVVEAQTSAEGQTFFTDRIALFRDDKNLMKPWVCQRGRYAWADLIDPVLIRQGVES